VSISSPLSGPYVKQVVHAADLLRLALLLSGMDAEGVFAFIPAIKLRSLRWAQLGRVG